MNYRDTTSWRLKDTIYAFATRGRGCKEYLIDYADSPDRYLLREDDSEVLVGWRQLYRFLAFPVTQYYVLTIPMLSDRSHLLCRKVDLGFYSDLKYPLILKSLMNHSSLDLLGVSLVSI